MEDRENEMRKGQSKELMENQLRLVMIDRMLKEKYNEISYLAIQPPKDPQIVEIHQKDLNWLLEEQAKCEKAQIRIRELEEQKKELQEQYLEMVHSRTWRWGGKVFENRTFCVESDTHIAEETVYVRKVGEA